MPEEIVSTSVQPEQVQPQDYNPIFRGIENNVLNNPAPDVPRNRIEYVPEPQSAYIRPVSYPSKPIEYGDFGKKVLASLKETNENNAVKNNILSFAKEAQRDKANAKVSEPSPIDGRISIESKRRT